jgi:hypothetical protein
MAKRYEQMLPLIDEVQPRVIVEVGVHGALRANLLCRRALKYGPVHYIGYDVFDTMGEKFQADALNGKGTAKESRARERLDAICRDNPKFSYELKIGDTRKTLHGHGVKADFAFIDGDHRVDAIEGDYAALASGKCVVFDDYYRPGKGGQIPDLSEYGANAIVDALPEDRVSILDCGDKCDHGAVSHLAVVR